jgi:hypothetical protein
MSYETNLSASEKIHLTNKWCQSIGIKSKDLDSHPQIDDVIILINFRNEFWQDMDKSEQGIWAAYWSWVYHKQVPIKKAWLIKLETIIKSVEFKQIKQAQRLATIKAYRARAKEQNGEVHMTANPSPGSEMAYRVSQ